MIRNCPNSSCQTSSSQSKIRSDGFYFRKSDSRQIQRFRCSLCGKRFSSATHSLAYYQKKRRVNFPLFKLLASGVSMRRCAKILNIHRITVKRKLHFLAQKARLDQARLLRLLQSDRVLEMQFDDLITSHHSKLKPLSISAAVDANRRYILGAEVSVIPAFGHLAELSRKKYGRRKSQHKKGLQKLFGSIQNCIDQNALIKSDEHKTYSEFVSRHFPKATYQRYKGGRGCVVGQGELKKLHYDPLFALNHSFAMMRANINRLFRRTWCTTKDPQMLKNHLDIYISYHNNYLI